MRGGVFVTGTDTGIGKTVVAACLVHRWGASYWKPIQTGIDSEPGDSETVARLSGAGSPRIYPPLQVFRAPLSPEAAARRDGGRVRLDDYRLPDGDGPIVVEGAGGVLVPLGAGVSMADLMRKLGLPVLLVARSTLGTINHSLLSLEALRARGLAVAGVVMVGPEPEENAEAIGRLGGVRILACLPVLPTVDHAAVSVACGLLPALDVCLDGAC
jgi:malonyl-CoA O-methyltransferase